eukprot:TRINITY_DN3822_c0_g1_i6.p1 TRINITY_DN3822_c0_g1~~TRINITY_DN3822_c0_g1_i6.p1  ORF type:complete len:445 (+),score=113.75 TRINITY_DN3822_c0_g1_i6:76-1410(+)
MSAKDTQAAARVAMSKKAKSKKSGMDLKKNIVIGLGVVVGVAALYLAATDDQGRGKKSGGSARGSRANSYVNDRYFVSDVTSYSAGNFTAAASPFFDRWTYGDVSYGLDGTSIRGEGMIGFAGALQRCEEVDANLEGGAVPSSYDIRTELPSCTGGAVYDSQNCSSSYAVAAATALSARFCYHDKEKYANTRLSPQQIISCDKKSQGCAGGGIDSVWAYIEKKGLFPDSCIPFGGAKSVQCKTDCEPSTKLKAISHCLMSGAKNIKREMWNRGPVVAPLYLKDDFLVYKSGVYTPTDNANQQYGGDGKPIVVAVTIMGWGRSEGTNYWLVKNSWGANWGEEGYARVAIGSGAIKEEAVIVGNAATEEAIAEAQAKAEAAAKRKEELKKERAERDARIREREAQRAAEQAEKASAEEDLDFEDDEELDLDSDSESEGEGASEQAS